MRVNPLDFPLLEKYNKLYKSYFSDKGELVMKKPKGKYAWTVTVGEKGQIVIPKQARELFDITPGDTLVILGDESRGLAIPPKSAFARFASAVFETGADEEREDAD